MNNSPFNGWLDFLRLVYPPNGLIHIGAGGENSIVEYERWGLDNVVLVEANPRYFAHLQDEASRHKGWAFHAAILDQENRETTFYDLSLTSANGLEPPMELLKLWPNLQELGAERLSAQRLDSLIGTTKLVRQPNWLVISCFAARRILAGGATTLSGVDVVVVQAILNGDIKTGSSNKQQIHDQLEKQGYVYAAEQVSRNPMIGFLLYIRPAISNRVLEEQRVKAQESLAALQTSMDEAVLRRSLIAEELGLIQKLLPFQN